MATVGFGGYPLADVRICANPVKYTQPFGGLTAYHLFIMTTDQRAVRYFYRAGPQRSWPPHGPVTVLDGHYIPRSPDWNGNGRPAVIESIPGWQVAQNLHSTLAAALKQVQAAQVSYHWFGPNSNSTVGEMLRAASYAMLQPADHAPAFRYVQPYPPHRPGAGSVPTTGGTVSRLTPFGRNADLDSPRAAQLRRELAQRIRLGETTIGDVMTLARDIGLDVSDLMDGRIYGSNLVAEGSGERPEHMVYVTFFFDRGTLTDYDVTDAVTAT